MSLGTGTGTGNGLTTPPDVARFTTLSSLLASPPAGRATALDAPGSMLYEVGRKWGGSFGYVTASQVAGLQDAITAIAIGAMAIVPNAAVPGGLSRLRRGASVWAPPSGEPICAKYVTNPATPLASLASGILTVQKVYESTIIPDYMIPDGIAMAFRSEMQIKNTVSPQAGAKMSANLAGSFSGIISNNSLFNTSVTPTTTGGRNMPPIYCSPTPVVLVGSTFSAPGGAITNYAEGWFSVYNAGNFAIGSTRIYFSAQPSHASDVIELLNFELKAR